MTKREYARMQKLMKQPDIAARLQKFADEYFAEREAAMVKALKGECAHRKALHAAFLFGVQSAFDYQKNPPRALARYARDLASQVRSVHPKGAPCWYCKQKPPKRHAPACPFFGVKVGREHP
jgi:hypothetical protein